MTPRKECPNFIYRITMTTIMFVMFVVANYYESLLLMKARYVIRRHEPDRASVSPWLVLLLDVALSQEPGLSKVCLDPSVITALPIFEFCVGTLGQGKANERALEFSVCLSMFDDGDKIRILPNCNHSFHAECIDKWLELNTTCPVCRAGVAPMLQHESPVEMWLQS